MKAIMFTAAFGTAERQRFERAITAATLVIKNIYVTLCMWQADDMVFDGAQEDYQKLYFWICGYGDALAVLAPSPSPELRDLPGGARWAMNRP